MWSAGSTGRTGSTALGHPGPGSGGVGGHPLGREEQTFSYLLTGQPALSVYTTVLSLPLLLQLN